MNGTQTMEPMDVSDSDANAGTPSAVGLQNEDQPRMTAIEIQQEYFDNLMDCDWVKYERSNRKYLIQNIAFALFGCPSEEGDLIEPRNSLVENGDGELDLAVMKVILQGYTSRQSEQVVKIYEKICNQGKYSLNDHDILLSVLLVVCCRPKKLGFFKVKPTDYWWDLHNKSDIIIWHTAVFRVRKCIPAFDGAKSCRLYIDEDARVYHSWQSYLENNTLPECVMVAPKDGEYTGDLVESTKLVAVKLTVAPSPSLGPKARILSVADTTSTLASFGAIGVLGAAMFTPVGPVVLAGAAVATVTTGVYGLVRSSLHLADRSKHEQPISPSNAEARGSWINIAASTVGVTAGAASTLLSRSAAAGTNMTKTGIFLEKSVDVLRHANLVTGGVGIANSLHHFVLKYHKHGETPSGLELFQFASSALFFANAVMSNRTARSIIEEAQSKTINEYRDTLRSNRHRRAFDKVSAETRRVTGSVAGNAEVIQGIRNIANKDQYFADVLRINKDVNRHQLRISMTADGSVNLNAQHRFNPADLAGLSRDVRSDLFTQLGPADLNASNVPTRLQSPTAVARYVGVDEEDSRNSIVRVNPGEILRIGTMLFRVTNYSADQLADILHDISKDLYSALMTVACNVISKLIPEDIAKLRLLSPDKDIIVQVVEFVFNYLKQQRPLGTPCSRTDNGIGVVLKEFFQDGQVHRDSIKMLTQRFTLYIDEQMSKRREQYPNKREITCGVCNGIRYE